MAGSEGLRCGLTIYGERARCGSGEPDLRYRAARLRQDASSPSGAQQRYIIALISGTTVVSRKGRHGTNPPTSFASALR
jgi:hypothetical protein